MSRLNRYTVLLLILLLTFLFGQRFESRKSDNYTFKDAVNKYSKKEYVKTKHILDNLSFSEQMQYEEEIELLLMKTEYRLSNFSESENIGKNFLIKYSNSSFIPDVYLVFGDILYTKQNFDTAYRTYIISLKSNPNKKTTEKLHKRLLKTLQYGISAQTIDELLYTEVNEEIIQVLLLSKAHIALSDGSVNAFSNYIDRIDRNTLSSPLKKYYDNLVDKSESESSKVNIPVVLPLSGKDSEIGIDFLDGLKFAQSNNTQKDMDISFIVYDNESDQLRTIEILERINNNDNLMLLGPIGEANSIITGSYSNQLDFPVILPYSINDDLASISQNLYFMNSDLKVRGETAAKLIAEDLTAENIVVLAPANKDGKGIVDAFTNELNKYDLSPIIIEWYAGVPMNLNRQFESIREKAWELHALTDTTGSDSIYFENPTVMFDSTLLSDSTFSSRSLIDSLLAVFKAENDLMTKDDSADVVLETIDAIYMPINSADLEYVGAQFPAYNLETIVIGNDNWTNTNILQKENIGPHLDGMLVISNYKLHSVNQLNTMIDQKRTQYFYQAIDSYNMILDLVRRSSDWDRSINQLLNSAYYYSGVFGSYNFSKGSNVNSNLNVFEFDGRRFNTFEKDNQFIN